MKWIGMAGVALVVTIASWGIWARRRWLRRTALVIPPLSSEHYKFLGHDEALAIRTLALRAEAEEIKRSARQIETRDARRKLHLVG